MTKPIDLQENSQARLDKDGKILLDALGFEPLGVGHLVIRTGLKAAVGLGSAGPNLRDASNLIPEGFTSEATRLPGPET